MQHAFNSTWPTDHKEEVHTRLECIALRGVDVHLEHKLCVLAVMTGDPYTLLCCRCLRFAVWRN